MGSFYDSVLWLIVIGTDYGVSLWLIVMAKDQGGILWLKVIGTDHGVMYVGDRLWVFESKNHSIQSLYVEYRFLYFTLFRTYRIPSPRVGRKLNRKGKKFKRKSSSMKQKKGFRRS